MSVTVNAITDQWNDGKRLHVIGTLAFTGNYTSGGDTLDFGAGGVESSAAPLIVFVEALSGFRQLVKPANLGTDSHTSKLQTFGGASDAAATGTLTSDNTNVADGDTVTIGTTVYTFKTTITGGGAVAYNVKIGASADASLASLVKAINGTGVVGTDVGATTAANTNVSAGAVTSHATLLTALVSGSAGNAIATTETSAHLSFGAATLTGGVDGTSTGAELAAGAYPTDVVNYNPAFYAIFLAF